MASSQDTSKTRNETDASLRAEREQSDTELLSRSHALAEDSDDVIRRARERARRVLELARVREDDHLARIGASDAIDHAVREERRAEDATLDSERAVADAARWQERERRRAAILQLLAYERAATDRTLAAERTAADQTVCAREDLLALVAHDLRNMLTSVVVNASTILLSRDLDMAMGAGGPHAARRRADGTAPRRPARLLAVRSRHADARERRGRPRAARARCGVDRGAARGGPGRRARDDVGARVNRGARRRQADHAALAERDRQRAQVHAGRWSRRRCRVGRRRRVRDRGGGHRHRHPRAAPGVDLRALPADR